MYYESGSLCGCLFGLCNKCLCYFCTLMSLIHSAGKCQITPLAHWKRASWSRLCRNERPLCSRRLNGSVGSVSFLPHSYSFHGVVSFCPFWFMAFMGFCCKCNNFLLQILPNQSHVNGESCRFCMLHIVFSLDWSWFESWLNGQV